MAKPPDKLARQMQQLGWSWDQVEEARTNGTVYAAINRQTGGPAKRYVHPVTRRSVVIDDRSGEVIHVGGDGFIY